MACSIPASDKKVHVGVPCTFLKEHPRQVSVQPSQTVLKVLSDCKRVRQQGCDDPSRSSVVLSHFGSNNACSKRSKFHAVPALIASRFVVKNGSRRASKWCHSYHTEVSIEHISHVQNSGQVLAISKRKLVCAQTTGAFV